VDDPVEVDPEEPDDPDPVVPEPEVPDFCPRDAEAAKKISIRTRQ